MKLNEQTKIIQKNAAAIQKAANREIEAAYRASLQNIKGEMASIYEKYSVDGKLSQYELSKFNRLQNMQKTIADEVKNLSGVQVQQTKFAIEGAYTEAFQRSMFGVAQTYSTAVEAGMGLVHTEAVKAAVAGPFTVGWAERIGKNTKLLNKNIRGVVTQGIINGDDYAKVAKKLNQEMQQGLYSAKRIVATETHRAHTQGTLDAYERAAKKGVKFKKVWVSTLDDRTRLNHQIMDGQKVDGPEIEFTLPGGNKTKGPGLSGIAKEDINCRCTVIGEIAGYEPTERRGRSISGDGSNEVYANINYNQWLEMQGKSQNAINVIQDAVIEAAAVEAMAEVVRMNHADFSFLQNQNQETLKQTLARFEAAGNKVTDKEFEQMFNGIEKFSGSWSTEIRNACVNPEKATEDILKKVDSIENYIAKSPKWNNELQSVQRGIRVSPDISNKLISSYQNGELIDMRGCASWSSERSIAQRFAEAYSEGQHSIIFHLNGQCNQGASIQHLSNYRSEAEVLMSKDARYKILSVQEVTNNAPWTSAAKTFIYQVMEV